MDANTKKKKKGDLVYQMKSIKLGSMKTWHTKYEIGANRGLLSKIPNCLDVCRALNIFRVLFKVGHFELVACHVAVPCYPRAKQIQSLPCNPFV